MSSQANLVLRKKRDPEKYIDKFGREREPIHSTVTLVEHKVATKFWRLMHLD